MVFTVLKKVYVKNIEKLEINIEKCIRFMDIFLSGLFFIVFFAIIYGLLERTGFVPYIAIWRAEWIEWDYYNPNLVENINMFEGYVIFCITFMVLWIISQLVYWKIRKYRIM